MKFYKFSGVIPIRLKTNQYSSYYGQIIGFDASNGAVIVVNKDEVGNKNATQYSVKFMSDALGTWWEQI